MTQRQEKRMRLLTLLRMQVGIGVLMKRVGGFEG